ncbi:MAG TPA: beta-ketoacyl-ACP synthase II [Solirubrobacteraceae bacterium]|jgi:3-oxoacyl-[acyl-carrier-protein] synthase II|nr:beta-ketoacyl-ACP synthase II [Solirubrobacteraceae bacterium]
MKRQVVVTGLGAVTPLGVGARTLFDRWRAGASGIEDGEGAATEFDPTEHLSVKEVRRADRFSQLAMVAGDEALDDAGWSRDELPYDRARTGCVYGTGIGGIGTLERGKEILIEQGERNVPALSVPLMMSNAAAGTLTMRYGLQGDSFGTVSACSASAHAIAQATRMIQYGDADAVITGGSEAALTPLSKAAFAALDAVSDSGISRPFDARRDGFVMGEGAAVLVLEDAEKAAARGARALATVRGFGATSDAHHLTAPHPEGAGAAAAISKALRDSEVQPDDVDYINAHGTSTPLNDRAETRAIKAGLGDHADRVPVSSTKSAIGHLLGAAGAVEATATILALRERIAPPTLGWEEREEGMDLDYVPGQARPLEINGGSAVALSNAFGFGGHNVVLCLEV